MIPIKKFTKGEIVKSFAEVLTHAGNGGYFYDGKRLVHGAWISNMGLASVSLRLALGTLNFATRNPQAPFLFEAEKVGEIYRASCSEVRPPIFAEAHDLQTLEFFCRREIRGRLGLDWAMANNCDPKIELRYRS